MRLSAAANFLIVATGIVYILIVGKSLLIPFVFAVLLWVLVREINHYLDKVSFIEKYFPKWLKTTITSIVILSILGVISKIISSSISQLAKSYKVYENNVHQVTKLVNETLNIDAMEMLGNQADTLNIGNLLSMVFSSITDVLSSTFMILIYALFVFMEEANFGHKLRAVFTKDDQFNQVSEILDRIEDSVTQYLGLKVLVSMITGVASFIVLWLIGIDSPAFWSFLIFLLNFIPTIGSLVATVFPALFSLLQFGELGPGILVLVFVGAIQVLVGNIIEPKIMGNSLNLSALVTIIALSVWGAIWGIIGMVLSVPITVIMVIVMSQFEKSRPIAMMLSEKGVISAQVSRKTKQE